MCHLSVEKWYIAILESKVRVANMGPTWVLEASGGPHVDPMNLAIRDVIWKQFNGYLPDSLLAGDICEVSLDMLKNDFWLTKVFQIRAKIRLKISGTFLSILEPLQRGHIIMLKY